MSVELKEVEKVYLFI